MADVFAIFGILFTLGITFPGYLTTLWLAFPGVTSRAKERLELSPGKCFGLGLLLAFASGLPVFSLIALPSGAAKFVGWLMLVCALVFSSLGAAGMAARLGNPWNSSAENGHHRGRAILRGAVLLELAVAFPVLGWFFILPMALIQSLGAAAFGLLGRAPKQQPAPTAPDKHTETVHDAVAP